MFILDEAQITSAATDFLVAFFSFIYSYSLISNNEHRLRSSLYSSMFLLNGIAALLGGIYHSIILPKLYINIIWILIFFCLNWFLILLALTATYDYYHRIKGLFFFIASGLLTLIILLKMQFFVFFIIFEFIIMIYALCVYSLLAWTNQLKGAIWMSAGFIVMMIGGVVQTFHQVEFNFIWTFDHNGIYHLISLIGATLLFFGVKKDVNGTTGKV